MLIQIFRFRSNVDLAAVAGKLLMDEAVESDPDTQLKKQSVLPRNGPSTSRPGSRTGSRASSRQNSSTEMKAKPPICNSDSSDVENQDPNFR